MDKVAICTAFGTWTLLDQYKHLHAKGKFPGYSLKLHVGTIGSLIKRTGSESLLDYGCGKGWQYSEMELHHAWGIMPSLYDPAVPGLHRKPVGRFDGVICTDVMEHIPERNIPATLDEIFGYAEKFVFLSICTRPSKKTLPDGRNCHLTVRPHEWWLDKIGDRGILTEIAWHDD